MPKLVGMTIAASSTYDAQVIESRESFLESHSCPQQSGIMNLERSNVPVKDAYERALDMEKSGLFPSALALFKECLQDPKLSRGDVLFHCGWCIEQQEGPESSDALIFYEQSVDLILDRSGRMNAAFRAGWVRMHRKDYPGAQEMLHRVVNGSGKHGGNEQLVMHAKYWLAVCLEMDTRYLDAITWYRNVRANSPLLDPESRLREIYCLVKVGDYEAAVELCGTFEEEAPGEFPRQRYEELARVAKKERELLESCLERPPFSLNSKNR